MRRPLDDIERLFVAIYGAMLAVALYLVVMGWR